MCWRFVCQARRVPQRVAPQHQQPSARMEQQQLEEEELELVEAGQQMAQQQQLQREQQQRQQTAAEALPLLPELEAEVDVADPRYMQAKRYWKQFRYSSPAANVTRATSRRPQRLPCRTNGNSSDNAKWTSWAAKWIPSFWKVCAKRRALPSE